MKAILLRKHFFCIKIRKAALVAFILAAFAFAPHITYAQTGKALNFDGVDDYVDLPFIVQSSYTKEAWINITTVDGLYHNILSGSQTAFYVLNGQLTAGHNPTYTNVQDPIPLTPGTWYHVAVTYDDATNIISLYKNGVMVASGTAPAYSETEGFIGAIYLGTVSDYFAGDIDEVRFWSVAHTAGQVAQDANCALVGNEPNLIAYYNLDQGTAGGSNSGVIAAIDLSPNSYSGALFNFALTGATSNWIAPGTTLSGPCAPLPIELSYFAVEKSGNKVNLVWKTASEHNNAGFDIERSASGNTGWQKVGSLTGAGNSSKEITYTYNDLAPIRGNNFYRLKQTDLDGAIKYSYVRSLKFDGDLKPMVIYPTVASNKITISLSDDALLNTHIFIIDIQGRSVRKEILTQFKQDVDINSLQKGVYFIKAENGQVQKFIKQ